MRQQSPALPRSVPGLCGLPDGLTGLGGTGNSPLRGDRVERAEQTRHHERQDHRGAELRCSPGEELTRDRVRRGSLKSGIGGDQIGEHPGGKGQQQRVRPDDGNTASNQGDRDHDQRR